MPDLVPTDEKPKSLVDKWMADRAKTPDVGALAESVLSEFGGPAGLAHEIKTEYDAGQEGGIAKTSLLRMSVDLIQAAAKLNGVRDPLENMSREEAEAILRHVMKQQNGS